MKNEKEAANTSGNGRESRLWHKQTDPDKAGMIGSQIAEVQRQVRQPRKEASRKHGSMYEGQELTGLDGDCFESLVPVCFEGAPMVNNRCQSVINTLQAKLAALDEPRPQFVVTDGSYEQKRQAVWLDRFVEGQYYQQQGMYRNMWHLWRHAFLYAAAATGTCAVKVFPDMVGRKIVAELHNTMEMWVDPLECRYGVPLTYGESTWFDAEKLADESDSKYRDDIWNAAEAPAPDDRSGRTSRTDALQVEVHELWRVRSRADQPGKYLRVVGNKALAFDDYLYTSPPFAFYHFRQRLGGFWGASATETFYQSVVRENQVIARMDEGEARSQTIIQYYDPSVQGSDKLSVPKHVVLIPYNSENGAPPQAFAMPWYGQQAPELRNMHAQNTHDASGISAMQTTGQAQTGLTAAVAIRTVLSLLNERFAPQQRDIVQAVAVDTAYLFARAAKEIYDEFGEFDSVWHGKSFRQTLPGADCLSLPLEIYTVQVKPVSEKKNSPEDRIQLANELVTQGIITGGDWIDTLRTMDTPGATRRFARVEEWCEKLFDKFLYAPESAIGKSGFYLSPPKAMDLDYVMALATDAFLSAQIDDVPENRRALLMTFMGDVSRKIDQRDTRRQSLQQATPAPGGAPTPGQQQGAPAPPALPEAV